MGARAAVMAVSESTTHLVLVSYPLHTAKETRDQVLLDLPPSIKVIFVSGDRDEMCDLDRLEEVRRKMRCKTWRVVVENADHGMNVKPKAGTRVVGEKTGNVVAMWLNPSNISPGDGKIVWDANEETAQWSGWSPGALINESVPPLSTNRAKQISTGKRKRRSIDVSDSEEPKPTRSRKRKAKGV